MSIFRFSLRWLLALVAFVAVGIASLRYASVLISGTLAIAWLLILTVAALGVVYGDERRRAFWLGCCLLGWTFSVHTYLFFEDTALERAVQSVYARVSWNAAFDVEAGKAHQASGAWVTYSQGVASVDLPAREPFEAALRILIGIVASVVAGAISLWFHAAQGQIAARDKAEAIGNR